MILQPRKHFRRVPFGYIQNPENPEEDIPDPVIGPLLEEALLSLNKGNPLRDTAAWLSKKTGKDISHVTLRWIWHGLFPEAKAAVKPTARKKPKNKEERELIKKKKLISSEKRKITDARKRLVKMGTEVEELKEELLPKPHVRQVGSEVDIKALTEDQKDNIAFSPNPGPQTEFLASDEREVLYGGAAGGELKNSGSKFPPPFAVMRQNKTRELLESL